MTVVPVQSERQLRNLAWMDANRKKVDDLTGGQVAYVYVPDTSAGGYTSFNRYFFAQTDKQAAIIDERFNGGGTAGRSHRRLPAPAAAQLPHRPRRRGRRHAVPRGAIFGPKVMIVNERAGSGGDYLP